MDAEESQPAGAAVNAGNADGHRPVHATTRAGSSALAMLLERGAKANLGTLDTGNSRLHSAVDFENVAGVELLLANGADRTLVNKDGQTPLDLALRASIDSPSDEVSLIVGLLRQPEQ